MNKVGIKIKGLDIAPLLNESSGSIEITKKLFRELVKRKRLTSSFMNTAQKVLLKQGVHTVETERDSYIFTKPVKRYDNFISYSEDLKSASESMKSEQLECRTYDIKLMELLDEAEFLFSELEDYSKETIINGKSVNFFGAGKNEHGAFILLEEITEVRESLTEVYYEHIQAKEFRDEFECFFDGIHNGSIWDFIDRAAIDEAKDLSDKEDILIILDELFDALNQSHEEYQLNYP
jgi:hypothetical protein